MTKLKISAFLCTLFLASPTFAGSLYLTGHDTLDHDGQNGYWLVIVDYLRGKDTAEEIAVADYDIAVFCPDDCTDDMTLPSALGWAGSETLYEPEFMDDAAWADAFSKDLVLVTESSKIGALGRDAFNARDDELASYFDAGGDLWMNSSNGDDDYYTVLPASVLSTGSAIDADSGFSPTAAGVAIGIVDNMVNGHQSHNVFSSVAPVLTVFERFEGTQIMSVGAQDTTISVLSVGSEPRAIPTLSTMALWLLVLLIIALSYPVLRTKLNGKR